MLLLPSNKWIPLTFILSSNIQILLVFYQSEEETVTSRNRRVIPPYETDESTNIEAVDRPVSDSPSLFFDTFQCADNTFYCADTPTRWSTPTNLSFRSLTAPISSPTRYTGGRIRIKFLIEFPEISEMSCLCLGLLPYSFK